MFNIMCLSILAVIGIIIMVLVLNGKINRDVGYVFLLIAIVCIVSMHKWDGKSSVFGKEDIFQNDNNLNISKDQYTEISIALAGKETIKIIFPGIVQNYESDVDKIITDSFVKENYTVIGSYQDPFAYIVAYDNKTKKLCVISKDKENIVLFPLYESYESNETA